MEGSALGANVCSNTPSPPPPPPTPPVRGARVTHTLLPSTMNMPTPPFILPIYILV
jgi:hypothetical protein